MKKFVIGKFTALELAKKYGTPLYVYDKQQIISNISRLQNTLKNYYKNFRIHVAIKANNNPHLLKIAKDHGCNADCSNVYEIRLAKKTGFTNILYSGNYQSIDDLKYGLDNGVILNIDNHEDLKRLLDVSVPEIISFRYNPGFGNGKHKHIITAGPKAKFGITRKNIIRCYKLAKDSGIKRFGIHMMTGSCILDEEYFGRITENIVSLCQDIEEALGIRMKFIDIGGGLGIPYDDKEKILDLNKAARNITKQLERLKYKPLLIMEPGRFIFGNAGYLLTKVASIKHENETFIGLDVGMNTLIRPALYGAHHRIMLAKDVSAKKIQKVNFCGQICESTDIFSRDKEFPAVEIGDVLVIRDVGAYGFVMSSQYNTIPRPAEILVDGKNPTIIRKRECFEDLIRNT